jgi:hypothetical protein
MEAPLTATPNIEQITQTLAGRIWQAGQFVVVGNADAISTTPAEISAGAEHLATIAGDRGHAAMKCADLSFADVDGQLGAFPKVCHIGKNFVNFRAAWPGQTWIVDRNLFDELNTAYVTHEGSLQGKTYDERTAADSAFVSRQIEILSSRPPPEEGRDLYQIELLPEVGVISFPGKRGGTLAQLCMTILVNRLAPNCLGNSGVALCVDRYGKDVEAKKSLKQAGFLQYDILVDEPRPAAIPHYLMAILEGREQGSELVRGLAKELKNRRLANAGALLDL